MRIVVFALSNLALVAALTKPEWFVSGLVLYSIGLQYIIYHALDRIEKLEGGKVKEQKRFTPRPAFRR